MTQWQFCILRLILKFRETGILLNKGRFSMGLKDKDLFGTYDLRHSFIIGNE